MSYALIHWESENTFSTVHVKNIDTGEIGLDQVVGGEFRIKWNRLFHTGRVINTGSREEIENMELDYAQAAADLSFQEIDVRDDAGENTEENSNNENGTGDTRNTLTTSQILENDEVGQKILDNPTPEYPAGRPEENIMDVLVVKDNEIAKLRAEMEGLKKQNKKYQRYVRKSGPNPDPSELSKMQIADGVEVDRTVVDLAKLMYSGRPSVFFRKLAFEGGIFSMEEIAESSITGKSSPMCPNVKRPRLDPVKFEALKKFTKECCGIQEKTTNCFLFEQSLRNLTGDARKKLRSRRQGRMEDGE